MNAYDFFLSYLALFVVLLFYAIGYAWKREGWRKLSEIDVDSGRRHLNHEEYEKLKARKAGWPMWKRVMHYVF
jgi:amino acid transporter